MNRPTNRITRILIVADHLLQAPDHVLQHPPPPQPPSKPPTKSHDLIHYPPRLDHLTPMKLNLENWKVKTRHDRICGRQSSSLSWILRREFHLHLCPKVTYHERFVVQSIGPLTQTPTRPVLIIFESSFDDPIHFQPSHESSDHYDRRRQAWLLWSSDWCAIKSYKLISCLRVCSGKCFIMTDDQFWGLLFWHLSCLSLLLVPH